jgi:hypothetical protein
MRQQDEGMARLLMEGGAHNEVRQCAMSSALQIQAVQRTNLHIHLQMEAKTAAELYIYAKNKNLMCMRVATMW